MLTAEQILKANDLGKLEAVNVPEWGGQVFVKIMDGASRDRWELLTSKALSSPNTANVRASLVVACACDETGKRIFTDNQTASIGLKSSIALDRIYEVAKRINKLEDGDIEELEGN
jgi:hypothetical protein